MNGREKLAEAARREKIVETAMAICRLIYPAGINRSECVCHRTGKGPCKAMLQAAGAAVLALGLRPEDFRD